MAQRKQVYERCLKKPIDPQIQAVITKLLAAYQDVIPIPYTYAWDNKQRLLRVQSKLVSWTAIFTPQRAVVFTDISFIGRFLDTEDNQQKIVALLDIVADELGL
jgi:hypothetical protein